MGRILVVTMALSVLLAAHGTDASPPEGKTTMTHFALYDEESNRDGYHGFSATMEVYGFSLKPGQGSETSFSLADPGPDYGEPTPSNAEGMTIGWHVLPDVYDDSHTHFFTLWTNDGFESTGCLNMKCAGFQPEKGAAIAPGDVIQQVSSVPKGAKQNLNLKIVKDDGASGDWLVHAGLNRDPQLIGRFPKSLFTSDRAMALRFGGAATRPAPMGNGYLPATNGKSSAASISNIHFIDQKGQASLATWNLRNTETDPNVYSLGPIANGQFFYGGPWKATA